MELFSSTPAPAPESADRTVPGTPSKPPAGRLAEPVRMVILALAVCTVLSAMLAVSLM